MAYFERSGLFVSLHVAAAAILDYLTYAFMKAMNPIGFIFIVPAVFISFHTLWVLLNPYVLIFSDRVVIKRTMFSNEMWYLIDIKKISEVSGNGFSITYNDGEEEFISTFGIRPSHLKAFRDAFNHHVCKSVVERED